MQPIPGISGILLNEGATRGQDVIVLLVSSNKEIPDFKATSNLCETFSKIIPGISCNLTKLENESKIIEEQLKQTTQNTKDFGRPHLSLISTLDPIQYARDIWFFRISYNNFRIRCNVTRTIICSKYNVRIT